MKHKRQLHPSAIHWQDFLPLLGVAFLMALVLIPGCGASGSPHPVNASLARETLERVLTSWQEGRSPHDWQQQSPSVVVQDLSWSAGEKLKGFEIEGAGAAVDANLICDVKLELEGADGKTRQEVVTYLVGTSPVLTVFRQIIR